MKEVEVTDEIREAAKVVCKLRDNLATGLLNFADPVVVSEYASAVDHLVGLVLTKDDVSQIVKELIAKDPRGKSPHNPLEL